MSRSIMKQQSCRALFLHWNTWMSSHSALLFPWTEISSRRSKSTHTLFAFNAVVRCLIPRPSAGHLAGPRRAQAAHESLNPPPIFPVVQWVNLWMRATGMRSLCSDIFCLICLSTVVSVHFKEKKRKKNRTSTPRSHVMWCHYTLHNTFMFTNPANLCCIIPTKKKEKKKQET